MSNIIISDTTLRDGNHVINHKITKEQIRQYCQRAESAGIDIVEIGHGNGLGASSLQLGVGDIPDRVMLRMARNNLKTRTKLGIHIIPGFGTIENDLRVAIEEGVDVVRVASHCTEADTTQNQIKYARANGKITYGALMMSHMASKDRLLEESNKMIDYGATGIILMDSAGAYLIEDVKAKVSYLCENTNVLIGFHAHNNLGLAVANSLTAVTYGAKIIDATINGFGAGAGNTPLELLVAVLTKANYNINTKLYDILELSEYSSNKLSFDKPSLDQTSIISGLYGVFSGFKRHVIRISKKFGLDPKDIYKELGKRNIIAGQEDMIIEVADYVYKTGVSLGQKF